MEALVAKSNGSESRRHRALKEASVAWLREAGCHSWAKEVRLPLSRYRADAAGYRRIPGYGTGVGETFAIECKQCRSDFLRDAGGEFDYRDERAELAKERIRLRGLIGGHLPFCRRGESLFLEYDSFDFSDLKHERWRRLNARLSYLDRRLAVGVKFAKMARYACANYCYLATVPGVVKSRKEVPAGWGWLELSDNRLEVKTEALKLASRPETRLAFLEQIAAVGARWLGRKANTP